MKKAAQRNPFAFTLLLAITLVFFSAVSHADVTGNIQGSITDAAGKPLSGVIVSLITGTAKPEHFTTKRDGKFFFAGILNGNYTVTAQLAAHETGSLPPHQHCLLALFKLACAERVWKREGMCVH